MSDVHSELKWGPLEKIVEDTSITDIAILPDGSLWVDRGKGMEKYPVSLFKDSSHIREYAVGLCAQLNTRLDQGAPIGDASTLSGVRIHAEIEPIVSQGASISLRFPRSEYVSLRYLKEKKMISDWMELFFKEVISKKMSVLITGATGSGKTTLMKAFLEECPSNERIVIVEESRELGDLQRENYVSLVTRAPNIEKKGEITLSDLVRATLRMRPDRIVVGECRGREIIDLMRALTSGHAGGFSTLHAQDIQRLAARLYALGELAQISPSLISLLSSQAFDLVVHCERKNGCRLVSQIGILQSSRSSGEFIVQPQIVAFLDKNNYQEGDYEGRKKFFFTQEWNTFIERNHFSSQWLCSSSSCIGGYNGDLSHEKEMYEMRNEVKSEIKTNEMQEMRAIEINESIMGTTKAKGVETSSAQRSISAIDTDVMDRGVIGMNEMDRNRDYGKNIEEEGNYEGYAYEEDKDNTREFPKISVSQMLTT